MKTVRWDAAIFLHTAEDVADYLEATIQENYPRVFGVALQSAARARGGVPVLAEESQVAETEIAAAIAASDATSLPVLSRVQAAYQRLAHLPMVA